MTEKAKEKKCVSKEEEKIPREKKQLTGKRKKQRRGRNHIQKRQEIQGIQWRSSVTIRLKVAGYFGNIGQGEIDLDSADSEDIYDFGDLSDGLDWNYFTDC